MSFRGCTMVDSSTLNKIRALPALEGARWLCGHQRIEAVVTGPEPTHSLMCVGPGTPARRVVESVGASMAATWMPGMVARTMLVAGARPAEVWTADSAGRRALQRLLTPLGIRTGRLDGPSELDEAFDGFLDELLRYRTYLGQAPDLALDRFHRAAAGLFRRAPWEAIGEQEMLRVRGLTSAPLMVSVRGFLEEKGLFIFGPPLGSTRLQLQAAPTSAFGRRLAARAGRRGWERLEGGRLPLLLEVDVLTGCGMLTGRKGMELARRVVEAVCSHLDRRKPAGPVEVVALPRNAWN